MSEMSKMSSRENVIVYVKDRIHAGSSIDSGHLTAEKTPDVIKGCPKSPLLKSRFYRQPVGSARNDDDSEQDMERASCNDSIVSFSPTICFDCNSQKVANQQDSSLNESLIFSTLKSG
jgi:hypothetical protein